MVVMKSELEVEVLFRIILGQRVKTSGRPNNVIDPILHGVEKNWSKGWELIGGIDTGTLWLDAFVNQY